MEDTEGFVRELFALFNSGAVEKAAGRLTEDAVWVPYLGQIEGKVYRGRGQILAMWRDIREGLASLRLEPSDIDVHGERVIVEVHGTAVGAGSGADVADTWFQVWTLRDGRVAKVEAAQTREAALAAVTE